MMEILDEYHVLICFLFFFNLFFGFVEKKKNIFFIVFALIIPFHSRTMVNNLVNLVNPFQFRNDADGPGSH